MHTLSGQPCLFVQIFDLGIKGYAAKQGRKRKVQFNPLIFGDNTMNKIVAIALAAVISTNAMAAKIIDRPVPKQPDHQEIPSLQAVNTDYVSYRNNDRVKFIYVGEQVRATNNEPERIGSDK